MPDLDIQYFHVDVGKGFDFINFSIGLNSILCSYHTGEFRDTIIKYGDLQTWDFAKQVIAYNSMCGMNTIYRTFNPFEIFSDLKSFLNCLEKKYKVILE